MCVPIIAAGILTAVGVGAAAKALTPDLPRPPPAPDAPPKAIDPKVQGARARERDRAKASAGFQSTTLTGGGGLTATATTQSKTLLGS